MQGSVRGKAQGDGADAVHVNARAHGGAMCACMHAVGRGGVGWGTRDLWFVAAGWGLQATAAGD